MQEKILLIQITKNETSSLIHWIINTSLEDYEFMLPICINAAHRISATSLTDKSCVNLKKELNFRDVAAVFGPLATEESIPADLVVDVILRGKGYETPFAIIKSTKSLVSSKFTKLLYNYDTVNVNYILQDQVLDSLSITSEDNNTHNDLYTHVTLINTTINILKISGNSFRRLYLKDHSSAIYVTPYFFGREGIIESTYPAFIINSLSRKPRDVSALVKKHRTLLVDFDKGEAVYDAYTRSNPVDIYIDSTSEVLLEHTTFPLLLPVCIQCHLVSLPIEHMAKTFRGTERSATKETVLRMEVPEFYYTCDKPLHLALMAQAVEDKSYHVVKTDGDLIDTYARLMYGINTMGTVYLLASTEFDIPAFNQF